MLNLTRANPKRQRPKRAMRTRMAVPTYHRRPGQGEPLLGPNNMHDPLSLVAQAEIREAEFLDVVFEGGALEAGIIFFDEVGDVLEVLARRGGHVVVGGGERAVRAPHAA